MNKEILSLLKRLGLNQYESKTYLALLNAGSTTATNLSDLAEIPRPRVYDVLAKLVKKGFAATKPTRPTKYMAIPPSSAISSLKKEKKNQHQKELEELEALKEKLGEQVKEEEPVELGSEETYVLRGRKNIYSVMADLIKKAKKQVHLTSSQEGLARKRREHGVLLKKARERGVTVEMVKGKPRIAIIDDNALIFLSQARNPKNEEAAWIKSPFVADSFREVLSSSGKKL